MYRSPQKIGEGSIIMHGAIINACAEIGKNTIINTGVLIEHDTLIEDNCHVATRAVINGNCLVQKIHLLVLIQLL